MSKPIACVGGIVADLLAKPVVQVPAPGRLELVDHMALATGGCACNAASALAKLGRPVRLVGAVGADDLGDYVLMKLGQRNVDVAGVARKSGVATSASMVLVLPDGERSFIHTRGATGLFSDRDIDWQAIAGCGIFFVAQALLMPSFDGEPTAAALRQARSLGMATALDTVWDATGAWLAKIGPCLPHLDYFLPSEAEAARLSGHDRPVDMAAFFIDRGVSTVAIKLGEAGCYVQNQGEAGVFVPAFPVTPVDATGAGDAWCAGFLAGIGAGLPPAEAARLGNAVGACCVTALGATDGIRDWPQTLSFMNAGA